MSKYSLIKLMENEEEGSFSLGNQVFDLLVTPIGDKTISDIENAIKNPKNYEKLYAKISISDLENYFGPQNPAKKRALEKQRGKAFPIKTADEIKKFKEDLKNPNKFKFKIEGNSLRFPQRENVLTLKQIEDNLKAILDNAKIKYNIERVLEN
jgi:hypothetical protein